MEHMKMLFMFIGGLGMFLYGMNVMADGLQKSAGNRMRKLLQFLTSNRLMGVLVGLGVTAIIQSSSATTVMVVGFCECRHSEPDPGCGRDHGVPISEQQ